ncbi:MAG: methylenetetrahydrofolate reductase [Candidatus Aminicenantes bacterium]|nr:methylenetetrahydrofolate reductase [Candidatus Aminicenantes bacterium]
MSLSQKIDTGGFLFTAELGPPKSCNPDAVRKKSVHFKNIVDGVNITDNQTAIVRLSSIAAAKILVDEGLEPVVQMTCRDRNRLALQSDLIGMSALGIENVLCLTGDHQRFGNHPEAKNVFDLDSIQLIATARMLRMGFFLSGEQMKRPPSLCIGGAANPFADPLEFRVLRLAKKIKAGAQFIQTQPVFDLDRFKTWMNRVREEGLDKKVAVLAGVMPVKSVRALTYMEDQVPGIFIPRELISRMKKAENPKEEGVKIAVETILCLKEVKGLRGIHLMPLMWESITPRIAEESGLLRKDSAAGRNTLSGKAKKTS